MQKNNLCFPIFLLFLLIFVTLAVSSIPDTGTIDYVTQDGAVILAEGFDKPQILNDGNELSYAEAAEGSKIFVSRNDGIASLYVVFDKVPGEWTITDEMSGKSVLCGTNGFLHEYIDLNQEFGYLPMKVQMSFSSKVSVSEIYAFPEGNVPEWVQKWNPPCSMADLMLISSHSDDEQLFFAGVLPYYAGEMGLEVQVVYIVNHFDTHERPHEQLNGLWQVGVRNYPVMSPFPDLYSMSKEEAISTYEAHGVSYNDFVEYITKNIRQFKPLVVVSHDIEGEYGHGTHIVCTSALIDSLKISNDPEVYKESVDSYGVWQVQKTYLHLYGENPTVMNWDVPLDKFGGKTAFEVTRNGFDCHKSQHWTWFYRWIYGTSDNPIEKASDIKDYSPCLYGLYETKVGLDAVGGDFFENLKTYSQRRAETIDTEEISTEENIFQSMAETETIISDPDSEDQASGGGREVIFRILTVMFAVLIIITTCFFILSRRKRNRWNIRRRGNIR